MPEIPSTLDLRNIYRAAVQASDIESQLLTDWTDGSINDILAAAVTLVGSELVAVIVDEFNRTLIANTIGSERDSLVVDHFGESFARLGPQPAIGIATLSRDDTDEGDVFIPAGTEFSTAPDASGSSQVFTTLISTTMTGLELFLTIVAAENGPAGNVDSGAIVNIDSSLSDDSLTVTNAEATTGGADTMTDNEYLVYIGRLINSLRGSTIPSIKSRLLAINGIEKCEVIERFQQVKRWNFVSEAAEGDPFTIVETIAYIADANGAANSALIAQANDVIGTEKAADANIQIIGASAQSINWVAEITLNPEGPNYGELEEDTSRIVATMREYLDGFSVGQNFNRIAAKIYVLERWGVAGTADLVADGFTTITPTGNVQVQENIILIPSNVEII